MVHGCTPSERGGVCPSGCCPNPTRGCLLYLFIYTPQGQGQPFEFAGELVNWFMNWFGELDKVFARLPWDPVLRDSVRFRARGCAG